MNFKGIYDQWVYLADAPRYKHSCASCELNFYELEDFYNPMCDHTVHVACMKHNLIKNKIVCSTCYDVFDEKDISEEVAEDDE